MGFFELFKILLPIILELFKDKKAKGEVSSAGEAVECWNGKGQLDFVGALIDKAVADGSISENQKVAVVLRCMEKRDDPLMPLLIEYLYEMS